MKNASTMFAAVVMLFTLVTTGCDKKPADGTTNDLRSPTLVGKGGTADDGVKPVAPVARTGINDDGIKPVARTGIPDDSIKPIKPVTNTRGGVIDDSVRPVAPNSPPPVKPVPNPR